MLSTVTHRNIERFLYNILMNENMDLEKNAEIAKALKEFEAKSEAEQKQKAPEAKKTSEVPKMVELVMKWTGLKEQKQAEYVLLGFVIISLAISLYLFFGGNSSNIINYTDLPPIN